MAKDPSKKKRKPKFVPGSKWRVGANSDETGRLHFDERGLYMLNRNPLVGPAQEKDPPFIFDELCIDGWFHMEQMNDNVWWMRVGEATFSITIDRKQNADIHTDEGEVTTDGFKRDS